MFGQLIGAAFGVGPKNPKVPDLPRVNQQQVMKDTVAANQAVLPEAQKLASSVNTFNQGEILKMLRAAIPGYDQMTEGAGGLINSQLKGEIPKDVSAQVQNSAAARALGGGYGGSGMHRNLMARDLGLTSLDLTQRGLDNASRWLQVMKATSVAPEFNVASMFESPESALGREERYLSQKWNRDWAENQIKAKGSPVNQAAWSFLGNFDKFTWNVAESAAGFGMGKAMGGGGGGGYSDVPENLPAGTQYMSAAGQENRLYNGTPRWGAMSGY